MDPQGCSVVLSCVEISIGTIFTGFADELTVSNASARVFIEHAKDLTTNNIAFMSHRDQSHFIQ